MCMQLTNVRPHQCWNWHGDEIVHDSVIPASREVPNTKLKGYSIDIRSFVANSGNAVIRRQLHEIAEPWSDGDKLKFFARQSSCFDFRAQRIFEWISKLNYFETDRSFDQWLFPEETLARGGGDCEDLSFLLASLLVESGISRDCVRVALGQVVDRRGEREVPHDHAWVMYQQEMGAWQILDPLAKVRHRKPGKTKQPKDAGGVGEIVEDLEYVPCFVFNSDHLWRVRSPQAVAGKGLQKYLHKRNFWGDFDPSFAAGVHNSIFDEALTQAGMPSSDLLIVKAASLRVDVNVLAYDPRDHFDFAYITEGWAQVKKRLDSGSLDDFGLAVHAIGDFYAHSMYGHFAPVSNSRIPLYDPDHPNIPAAAMVYNFDGLPRPDSNVDATSAAVQWQGKLISGQWWRWYTTYPEKFKKDAKDLQRRRNLPDHDFLAVDSPSEDNPQHFFVRNGSYTNQFKLRQSAAVEHVAKAYRDWRKQHA